MNSLVDRKIGLGHGVNSQIDGNGIAATKTAGHNLFPAIISMSGITVRYWGAIAKVVVAEFPGIGDSAICGCGRGCSGKAVRFKAERIGRTHGK